MILEQTEEDMTSKVHRRAVMVVAVVVLVLIMTVAPAAAAPALQEGGGGETPVEGQLVTALLLAGVVELIGGHFLVPLAKDWHPLILQGIYLVGGGVLAWFAGVNLFAGLFPGQEIVGRILSCVLVGGGPGLIRSMADGLTYRLGRVAGHHF